MNIDGNIFKSQMTFILKANPKSNLEEMTVMEAGFVYGGT